MLPLTINGDCVERVPNFHFLWVHIEEALTWGVNTTELLRVLRKDNIAQRLLLSFYRCSIESVLTYCICAWYGCSTAAQRKALQRVINSAPKKIIICSLPTLEELHSSRCLKRAQNIVREIHHPGHSLFELQPSGRRYTNIKAKTNRLKIASTQLQSMYSMLLKDECACMCMWSCVLPLYCIYYVVLFVLECFFYDEQMVPAKIAVIFFFIIMLLYFVQWQ